MTSELAELDVIIPKVLPPSEPGIYELVEDVDGRPDYIPYRPQPPEPNNHYHKPSREVLFV